ncbi:hypothetical protein FPHYL_14255, partial [Fusarium phyllophilum]
MLLKEIVPDDGAPVTFFLPAEYRERVPPKHALSAKQVGHITRNITNAFRLGEEKADNDKVADLESSIDEQCTRSFVTHAAQPIYQLTTTPSSAAELQASPSVQRTATAKAVIHELCSRDDEEDHIWVYQVGTGVSKSAVTDRGPEHHEVRTNWPPGLVKPYADSKTDTIQPVGNLQTLLSGLFQAGYFDKRQKEYIRGSINVEGYKGVEINMYTMPDASTVMGECDAITLMNSRAHASTLTLAARFWNYSHNFQKESAKVNFYEMFPGLARAYKEGEFDDEVARLVETLQDAPAGHASCTGGPGSGKTTTVLNIVKAILSGAVEKVDISDPDAKEGEAMVSG